MRVLIVTSTYPSEDAPGFAPYIAEQVRSLGEAGVGIDLFEFNPRRSRLHYASILPHLIRKLRSEQYDILHTHHTYSFLIVYIARAIARSRVPIVLTSHEGEASDTKRRTRTRHLTSLLRHSLLLKRFAARRADFVIFVSQRLWEVIYPSGQCEVLPCGVDMTKFKPLDRRWCRQRLGIRPDAFVLLFPTNRNSVEKNVPLAQATYEVVRRRHPRAMMLTGGSIPFGSMPMYYNAADVVLQSSMYEGSPTIVKEALACEIPLVSTDVGDTQAVVRGVSNCFVCCDEPSVLADHVLMCEGQRAIGGRDRLLALGLSLEQTAQELIGVYLRIMSRQVGAMLSSSSWR